MCSYHDQNKGKWSRTGDRDAEPQRALRSHRNNREYGTSKLGFPEGESTYPKIICNSGTHFLQFAIPVLVKFKEYLL